MFFEGGLADCKTNDSEISIGNNGSTSTSIPATPKNQVGVLVTAELDKALKSCKEKVERIARDCRAQNKKFRYIQGLTRFFEKKSSSFVCRDIEFDLGNDKLRTYYGLVVDSPPLPDVRRVTEIFDKPKFFLGEPGSNDIVQGRLGDCWFLSALSTVATSPTLIRQCCVAVRILSAMCRMSPNISLAR